MVFSRRQIISKVQRLGRPGLSCETGKPRINESLSQGSFASLGQSRITSPPQQPPALRRVPLQEELSASQSFQPTDSGGVPRPVEVGIPKEEVTARVWVGSPIHTFDSESGTPPGCVGVRVWRCSILCIRFAVSSVGEGLTAVTSSPGTFVDASSQPRDRVLGSRRPRERPMENLPRQSLTSRSAFHLAPCAVRCRHSCVVVSVREGP